MKCKKRYLYLSMLLAGTAYGQSGNASIFLSLPPVALVAVTPNVEQMSLSFLTPSEAGAPITAATNTSTWLNYSSAILNGSRSITVNINQPIPGVKVTLQAGHATLGGGVLGTPAGKIILSNNPQNLVTGIGGAYTGVGIANGHQLTYSLEIAEYNLLLKTTNQQIIVTYTISN